MGQGSKLDVADRVEISPQDAQHLAARLFAAAGLEDAAATEVAAHLVEADLCGIESHGIVRVLQYVKELRSGKMDPSAAARISKPAPTQIEIDAQGGIGIPAMRLAVEEAANAAKEYGLAMSALRGAGHTGRLGAFAEQAAEDGVMTIIIGGGNRKVWRMVAPFGGSEAILPTNPYCLGIPGGDLGPVILDFATAKLAGGWIYAARAAGVDLPPGCLLNRNGKPTRDPEDYFAGGAILPKGEQMGSGLAIMAELIGEAMLGPIEKGEINWLILAVDCSRFRGAEAMKTSAEEILDEIRRCRPSGDAEKVEVPGERERARARSTPKLQVPRRIWEQITALDANSNG